jgi:hypothetical protein
MAQIIKANGEVVEIQPQNGTDFQLSEMREAIGGGYIEITHTKENKLMIVDEEGKIKQFPFNPKATSMHKYNDIIVGDVIICELDQVQ